MAHQAAQKTQHVLYYNCEYITLYLQNIGFLQCVFIQQVYKAKWQQDTKCDFMNDSLWFIYFGVNMDPRLKSEYDRDLYTAMQYYSNVKCALMCLKSSATRLFFNSFSGITAVRITKLRINGLFVRGIHCGFSSQATNKAESVPMSS